MSKFNPFNIRQYTHEQFQEFAAQYGAESARHAEEKEASFERCDTDGFLSQWASGINSSLAHRQKEILLNDGRAEFRGLYEGDRRVKAKLITFTSKYSHGTEIMWLLHESETALIAKRGKKYLPEGDNSRILKILGLEQREESDWAWAKLDGSGRGLSGQVWVSTFRVGDEWGGEAVMRREEVAA